MLMGEQRKADMDAGIGETGASSQAFCVGRYPRLVPREISSQLAQKHTV